MQSDVQHLAALIKDKLGIDLMDNIESLKRKITPRLTELNQSIWGYVQYLKTNPTEWEHIIECVTINETYFFREEEQLNQFIHYIKTLNKKTIRIWSAACSSGEEPYSLAILAKENIADDVAIEIVATDINQNVLDFARRGLYSKSSLSFRRIDQLKIEKYFEEEEKEYRIKSEYKNLVTFSPFNLVEESGWFLKSNFDVIFCRNVLIYFDEETNRNIIEHFFHALDRKGALFLGHSDPYRNVYEKFNLVRTPETLYLTKGDN